MMKFIFKRLLGAIPTVFFVITITFLLVHLTPGDPFSSDRAMSQQVLDKLHHQYGMDFRHLILPVIALSLPFICILAQIQRNSIVETLNSPFIRTAYAKGLSKNRIVLVHAIKPSLMPSISFLGPAAAGILTGTIIIEKVFALPGMGTQMVNAATNRDYSIVLALTIIYSILVVVFNLVVDILYGFIDPKARVK